MSVNVILILGIQLKSVWTFLNNMKRRIEEVEAATDVTNASFIL